MLRLSFLILLVVVSSFLAASERTWYVDPIKGVEGAHGTKALPMASITEALARIKNEPGNATIILAPGIYREGSLNVTNRQGRTTLQGTGNETIITGADLWTK